MILEPASTAVISGGEPGTHSVEGTGIGFIPPLLNADRYDEVRPIEEAAGRAMARRLAAEEGLLAGTSSGLNVVAAIPRRILMCKKDLDGIYVRELQHERVSDTVSGWGQDLLCRL